MSGASSSFFRAQQRLGRYQILGELGQGAFGSVFHAFDTQLNRDVAIKLLIREDARSAARFAREIQAAAKLRHPNIVSVHESGDYQGRPYLVMEFVDGDDLDKLAQGERPLSISRAVEIVRDAAHAIQHAHDQNVLHRDVKPQNILVDKAGQAFVVDFGLASLRDAGLERLSHTGLPLGTPAYMAPEQMRGEKVDEPADVFGLGGTLYYALCRQPPRGEGVSPFASASSPITPPSQIDPRVPPALDALCLEALHSDPWERFESAGAFGQALDRFLGGEQPASRPRRRSFALPVLAFATIAVGALLALQVTRSSSDPAGGSAAAESPTRPAIPPPQSAAAEALLERALGLARDLASADEIDGILEEAERAASGFPSLLERVQLARVRHAFQRAHHAQALALSSGLIDRPGATGLEARVLRALTLFRLDREPEGTAVAEALVRDDAGGTYGHCGRALLAGFRDHDQVAVARHAGAALELDPENHYALLQRALALANTERDDEALRLYGQFGRSRRPDDAHGYLGWAVALLNTRKRTSDSTIEIDRRIRLAFRLMAPRVTAVALRTRGHMYLFSDRPKLAIPDLKRAHELNPREATVSLLLGLAYDQIEDYPRAKAAFKTALATDARSILATHATLQPIPLRGRVARDLGLPAKVPPSSSPALAAYKRRRIQRVAPSARPALARALDKMQAGYAWEAIEPEFAAARKAAPDDAQLAWCEAEAVLGRGDADQARSQIQRARRLGAAGLELDFLEAQAYWRSDVDAPGHALFRKIAAADPKGVLGRSAQAHLDWQGGKKEQAVASLLALTKEHPTHTPSLIVLAILLQDQGRLAEGLEVATRASELVGFLNPWVMAQHAITQVCLSIREKRKPAEIQRGLAALENCIAATQEPSVLLMGANYVCEFVTRTRKQKSHWFASANRWLFEIGSKRSTSPDFYLIGGWLDLLRGQPAEQVLSTWKRARKAGLKTLPPFFVKAFQRKFRRAPRF